MSSGGGGSGGAGSGASGAEFDGGATLVSVTTEPIDETAIETLVMTDRDGALVTFRGVVRDHDHGLAVRSLEYSAHPDAERFLRECCETIARDTGLRVAAVHRTGALAIGEVALFAAVAAPHRGEAFAACEALVDLIKLRVPIWKRQQLADGATEWVGL
jgi:molybdopterin synthase catalytic subunit